MEKAGSFFPKTTWNQKRRPGEQVGRPLDNDARLSGKGGTWGPSWEARGRPQHPVTPEPAHQLEVARTAMQCPASPPEGGWLPTHTQPNMHLLDRGRLRGSDTQRQRQRPNIRANQGLIT